MSTTKTDPRSIITPDAFSVSPDLLGTPLAGPGRRLVALLIDLLFIGMLQLLGWGVLAGVAALIGLRLATRRSGVAPATTLGRGILGCASIFVFIAAVIVMLVASSAVRSFFAAGGDERPVAVDPGEAGRVVGLADLMGGVSGAVDLLAAGSRDEAIEGATAVGEALRAGGAERPAVELALIEAVENNSEFDPSDVVGPALEAVFGAEEASAEEESGGLPTEAVDTVRSLEAAVDRLQVALERAEDQLAGAQTELEEAESSSTVFAWVRDAADEAGLIFGWGTVYLTLFLVLWEGRTPGKKALDLRVVRLNGEPLDLFLSLERAGGYAAGFATGLLGFAQVFWDPNRQAIHDKIAETVVIRESLAGGRAKISATAVS